MYAIVLSDPYDPATVTVDVFEDVRIWEQMNTLVPPAGKSSWFVDLPEGVTVGKEATGRVSLTCGSFINDYAMAVAGSSAMTRLGSSADEAYEALKSTGIDEDHIYYGLYY